MMKKDYKKTFERYFFDNISAIGKKKKRFDVYTKKRKAYLEMEEEEFSFDLVTIQAAYELKKTILIIIVPFIIFILLYLLKYIFDFIQTLGLLLADGKIEEIEFFAIFYIVVTIEIIILLIGCIILFSQFRSYRKIIEEKHMIEQVEMKRKTLL